MIPIQERFCHRFVINLKIIQFHFFLQQFYMQMIFVRWLRGVCLGHVYAFVHPATCC